MTLLLDAFVGLCCLAEDILLWLAERITDAIYWAADMREILEEEGLA